MPDLSPEQARVTRPATRIPWLRTPRPSERVSAAGVHGDAVCSEEASVYITPNVGDENKHRKESEIDRPHKMKTPEAVVLSASYLFHFVSKLMSHDEVYKVVGYIHPWFVVWWEFSL